MKKVRSIGATILGVCLSASLPGLAGAATELHGVQFPEGRKVDLEFARTARAPEARLSAVVTYRDAQARIAVEFDGMKPAILYGGDVTCYVLWAITRSGQTENLGELLAERPKDQLLFSTGKKDFALLVTAEPYFLVGAPSQLVIFHNRPSRDKKAPSAAFAFEAFDAMPRHAMESIANISWDADMPLVLLQARKAYELASRADAAAHAARVFAEAENALARANELARKSPKGRQTIDFATRAVASSNEAINMAVNRKAGIELERQVAARRAEMASLESRASEAESKLAEVRRMSESIRAEQQRLSYEVDALRTEKTTLASDKATLEARMVELRRQQESLSREKEQLGAQLQDALSHVAEFRESARGLVINLPDILFDVNRSTLKAETATVLAKLSGILLVLPDLQVVVEGHTDATGSPDYNLRLSESRAVSVLEFLRDQGVAEGRLASTGYGMERPVADNDSAEGRAKNRRVEIVLSGSRG